MHMLSQSQQATLPTPSIEDSTRAVLQRKCECGQQTIAGGSCAACSNKGSSLQRTTRNSRPATQNSGDVPPVVHEVLRSAGQPLDAPTRAFFEPRFGYDFSHVRVHTDSRAAESALKVNALAYTVGQDIVLGPGVNPSSTPEARKTLAHELTHVIQQEGRSGSFGSRLTVGPATDEHESEADRIAGLVTTSERPIARAITPARLAIQRKCVDGHWQPDYDGCSVPWIGAALLGFGHGDDPASGFHHPGNPTGDRKDTRFAIPEDRTGACDKHDACYQTCWLNQNKDNAKKICDEQFHQDMLATCKQTEGKENTRCMRAADVYYRVVKKAGHSAFNKDQKKSCACEQK